MIFFASLEKSMLALKIGVVVGFKVTTTKFKASAVITTIVATLFDATMPFRMIL